MADKFTGWDNKPNCPHDKQRQAELADAVRQQERRGTESDNVVEQRAAHGVRSS